MNNNTFETTADVKIVIINHGITASGKSTVARSLVSYMKKIKKSASVHSTDNYFLLEDGHYHFDLARLGENHTKNQQAFLADLESGMDLVICDNTNLVPWQAEPYTDQARKLGYVIIFIDYKPREIYEHEHAQKVTNEHPDAHNIPLTAIERMEKEYWQYRDLLHTDTLIDAERHANFIWDAEKKERVKLPEPSRHFDMDYLIVVETQSLGQLEEFVLYEVKRIIKGMK
jgi:tRNA uridine 5-carbamoylmethylation protein Kti12